MASLKRLLPFLVFGCITCSCGRIVCKRYGETIFNLKIPDYDTSVKTTVRIITYKSGANFTTVLDSVDIAVNMTFNDSYVEEGKDYKLIILPQNRSHTITDVHIGSEKRKGSSGLESEQCYASVSFTLDGTRRTQPFWVEYNSGPSTAYIDL